MPSPRHQRPTEFGQQTGSLDSSRPDWESQLQDLEREGTLSTSWVRDAVRWLAELAPLAGQRRIVDVGAGPGYAAAVLAEAWPSSEVIAVDPTELFVARAAERFTELGLGHRVRAVPGELGAEALAALAPADLAWCARVVHHLPDPVSGLAELGRLLAPTGVLAVVEGGLAPRLLPGGYGVSSPGFVNRLEAALSDYFVHTWSLTDTAVGGEADWPVLLTRAGLRHRASRSFLLDLPAPVDPTVRDCAVARFALIQELVGNRLDGDDGVALARLLDPHDPAALANRPDLFWLAAVTVHVGDASGPHGRR